MTVRKELANKIYEVLHDNFFNNEEEVVLETNNSNIFISIGNFLASSNSVRIYFCVCNYEFFSEIGLNDSTEEIERKLEEKFKEEKTELNRTINVIDYMLKGEE
jgi:hypothetical protein